MNTNQKPEHLSTNTEPENIGVEWVPEDNNAKINSIPKVKNEASYSDQLKGKLAEARKSDNIAGLSDDQKDKAFELLEIMVSQVEACHSPELSKDCTIEMELMKGGKIKIVPPTGYHVMQGKRQMKLLSEKGDPEEMLSAYIMVACAEIDGAPVAMHDISDKVTARDFNILLSFFCRINLL